MALWHDIAARAIRRMTGSGPRPSGQAITADTEAGPVRLWLYRGETTGDDAPVYIHFPDTGFVRPAAGRADALARGLAERLGAVVLLVDTPLAPQHRFPVAQTEAQAVAWWAMMAGRKQGWNGKRLALGGQGSGANLALGACLELPARMGVKPAGVVAIAPVLDMAVAFGWRERIARAAMFPDLPARSAPLAAPLRAPAGSLDGFAPTLVAAVENDPRRGEGETFAAMLDAAGRDVTLVPVMHPDSAQDTIVAFLTRVFALKT